MTSPHDHSARGRLPIPQGVLPIKAAQITAESLPVSRLPQSPSQGYTKIAGTPE
jgi:hypothetical protein